jgi:hypothetical protein
MGYEHSHIAAVPVADVDRFVVDTHMKRGTYGAPANSGTMPTAGARHVTISISRKTAVDVLGTVTITGTDMSGQTITEVITPLDNATATGTKWFHTVTSVIADQLWVSDGDPDHITVGCDASHVVATGDGILKSIIVNTTAADIVTVADATGTIAVLKSNIAEGHYIYDCNFHGYLSVLPAAASDLTIVHSGSLPQTYAMK